MIVRALALAVSTLTILPVPLGKGRPASEEEVAASRWGYPVVGLAFGAVLAGLAWGLDRLHVSSGATAFVVVVAWAALSGGFHLDGLADSADGLLMIGEADRRLAAMKDPHVGSFGVVALTLDLAGKLLLVAGLPPTVRPRALFLAAFVGRTLLLLVASLARYARREGTARTVIEATRRGEGLIALALLMAIANVIGRASPGLTSAVVGAGLVSGLAWRAKRTIGGVTGDILGASVELAEIAVLLIWTIGAGR